MRTPKRVATGLLLACLAGAGPILPAPAAQARSIEFPQVTSLFRDALCFGRIRSWVETDPVYAGRAIFNIQALPITGFGEGPYNFAPLCETVTTMAWRNTSTGAAGEFRVTVVAGIYGSIQYALFQDTGPGRVEVNVFTDMPGTPQRGSFEVPAPVAPPPDPHPAADEPELD
ncbi:hypothetical protein [Nocardia yamanashiensis]|uniref:hypothetical protein n=1 Tax=Nocardia yamanashiensis TaxID=209247 RepID=UPI000831530C|nr:hypothetical protein [Nocardia yamanashiensis]